LPFVIFAIFVCLETGGQEALDKSALIY